MLAWAPPLGELGLVAAFPAASAAAGTPFWLVASGWHHHTQSSKPSRVPETSHARHCNEHLLHLVLLVVTVRCVPCRVQCRHLNRADMKTPLFFTCRPSPTWSAGFLLLQELLLKRRKDAMLCIGDAVPEQK